MITVGFQQIALIQFLIFIENLLHCIKLNMKFIFGHWRDLYLLNYCSCCFCGICQKKSKEMLIIWTMNKIRHFDFVFNFIKVIDFTL